MRKSSLHIVPKPLKPDVEEISAEEKKFLDLLAKIIASHILKAVKNNE